MLLSSVSRSATQRWDYFLKDEDRRQLLDVVKSLRSISTMGEEEFSMLLVAKVPVAGLDLGVASPTYLKSSAGFQLP